MLETKQELQKVHKGKIYQKWLCLHFELEVGRGGWIECQTEHSGHNNNKEGY